MGKKVLSFVIEVVVGAAIYTLILWLFEVIFDTDTVFSSKMLIQGIVFSLLFVPFSRWQQRKASRK